LSGERPAKELADDIGDLAIVGLDCEVSSVKEMDLGVRIVAFESFGAGNQEKRIVLSPNGEQRWLSRSEIILELRVKCDVARIVQEKVELDLVIAWSRQQGRIKRIGFGATWFSSRTPYTYCDRVDSGVRKSRNASRFAGVGSFQYFWIGLQPWLSPSS
jgi:hypothetical protein